MIAFSFLDFIASFHGLKCHNYYHSIFITILIKERYKIVKTCQVGRETINIIILKKVFELQCPGVKLNEEYHYFDPHQETVPTLPR